MVYEGSIFKGLDKIISKDDLRPVLGVAYIDNGNIVATNAYQLVKIDLSFFGIAQEDAELLEQKCIDIDTIKKLGVLKSNQKWFINEQGINVYKANSNKVGLIYPLEDMQEIGNYPNYNAIIPEHPVEQSSFGVNPQFMLNVERVYAGHKEKDESVLKVVLHGTNKAITMRSKCGKFLGLVMPINIEF